MQRRGTPYKRRTNRDKIRKKRRRIAIISTLAVALAVFGVLRSLGGPAAPNEPVALATVSPTQTPTAAPTQTPSPTAAPTQTPSAPPKSTAASGTGQEDFSDAVFIGDSRTVGLQQNGGLANAKFFCGTGLNVETAMTKPVVTLAGGSKGTVVDALRQTPCQRVYVMFGVNELGWPSAGSFKKKYVELIQALRQAQPEAEIYVQSILPISKEKSDSSEMYKQSKINDFNQALLQMASEEGVRYLNVASVVTGSDGYLPKEAATDGVHLTKSYCKKWVDYLKTHSK